MVHRVPKLIQPRIELDIRWKVKNLIRKHSIFPTCTTKLSIPRLDQRSTRVWPISRHSECLICRGEVSTNFLTQFWYNQRDNLQRLLTQTFWLTKLLSTNLILAQHLPESQIGKELSKNKSNLSKNKLLHIFCLRTPNRVKRPSKRALGKIWAERLCHQLHNNQIGQFRCSISVKFLIANKLLVHARNSNTSPQKQSFSTILARHPQITSNLSSNSWKTALPKP